MKNIFGVIGVTILFFGHVAIAQEILPSIHKKTEMNIEPLSIEVDNNLKVYYPSVTILKSHCGDVGSYLYQKNTNPINATFIAQSYEIQQDTIGQFYKKEYYIANILDSCNHQVAIEKTDVGILINEQTHNNASVQSIEKNIASF